MEKSVMFDITPGVNRREGVPPEHGRDLKYMPNPLLAGTKRFRDAVARLVAGEKLRAVTAGSRFGAEEALLLIVYSVKAKYPGIDLHEYATKLFAQANRLRQRLVAPRSDNAAAECADAWATEAIGVALWAEWWDPRIRRVENSSFEAAKAIAVTSAGGRTGPYMRAGWEAFRNSPSLQAVYQKLGLAAGRLDAVEELETRSYAQTTRQVRRLVPLVVTPAQEACVAVVKALAEMYPELPVGRNLAVDGSFIPAWCAQQSGKRNGILDPVLEAHLRRRTPDAGFRIHKRPGGVEQVGRGKKLAKSMKLVRGYLLVVISDMATGLPLVGLMEDASTLHEPHAIIELLPLLHDLWPECPAETLVADAAWDENGAHEFVLRNYGIALVAARKPSHRRAGGVDLEGDLFHPTVARVTGDGHAVCRAHGKMLPFAGVEVPSRAGVTAGEPMPSSNFRARWHCDAGCGRVSVKMDYGWSAMPVLPHNPDGRPDLHARRVALLLRRNAAETTFSSLKAGGAQGLAGSYRTRVLDRRQVEGFIWISFATRALLLLKSQRAK